MNDDEVPLVTDDHNVMADSPRVFLASVDKGAPLSDLLLHPVESFDSIEVGDTELIPPVIDKASNSGRDLGVVNPEGGVPTHRNAEFLDETGDIVVSPRSRQKIVIALSVPIPKEAGPGGGTTAVREGSALIVIGYTGDDQGVGKQIDSNRIRGVLILKVIKIPLDTIRRILILIFKNRKAREPEVSLQFGSQDDL